MPQLNQSPVRVAVTDGKRLDDVGRACTGTEKGSAVLTRTGERVRYTTPDGADHVAVCLPAFSPDTVHRED